MERFYKRISCIVTSTLIGGLCTGGIFLAVLFVGSLLTGEDMMTREYLPTVRFVLLLFTVPGAIVGFIRGISKSRDI